MILSRAPLRISFFGGGTDLPSFLEKEYGCVISTSIDKYVYSVVQNSFSGSNRIVYMRSEEVSNVEKIKHTRVREIMKKIGLTKGIEIHCLADVPAGTGLGSSSSFAVSLFNGLYAHQGKTVSKTKLAEDAADIEINVLKEPIGKQDQTASAFGGFNFIKFNTDGSVNVEPIKLDKKTLENEIEKKLLLFYFKKTRDASDILEEQNKNIMVDEEKFGKMQKMKAITLKMYEELKDGKTENFGEALHESWMLKKSLANKISSSYIDSLYERARKAGAIGGKVLGAGGGGFILLYCEGNKQKDLREKLKELRELKFKFETEGVKITYF